MASLTFLPTTSRFQIRTLSADDIIFQINTLDVVTFKSGGNVGIGTTAPGQVLDVNGRISMATWTADGDTAAYRDTATNSIALITSDRRLKKNIVPLTGSLNIVKQLNTYKYNDLDEEDGTKLRLGLMGQEVLPLIPELTYNFTKEGSSETYYGVHYDKLPVLLLGAIKEQQTQIDSLSSQLADFSISSTGDLEIKNDSQTPFVYDGNLENATYNMKHETFNLQKISGEVIDKIGAFGEIMVAKLTAGLLETENAIVNNTLIAKNIVVENLSISTEAFTIAGKSLKDYISQTVEEILNSKFLTLNSDKIVSPIVETTDLVATGTAQLNTIATNEIKPANNDLVVDLGGSTPPLQGNGDIGPLAKLIIKGLEGKSAVVIDAGGNASFSGQIIADSLQINADATVAGTLTADKVEAENISDLTKTISDQRQSLTDQSTSINDIQKLLADIKNQPIPDLTNETNLSNVSNFESITVTGQSNLYSVSVSNSLLVGTTLIDQNSIISLASELKLSALSTINLFDGAVIIAKDGTITTRGKLIAEKGIRTNEIKGLTDNDQVKINNLAINNLTINDKYLIATDSAAIIAAPDNFTQNGIFAPAIETASASAGLGILPENSSEVVIYNNNIKKNSLIYLTPTSDYPSNNQLTVVKKEYIDAKPYFKVVSATPSITPIKFNWLIIN